MSATSLSAYAAWLAKHETKATRRRCSASPVEDETDAREEKQETSTQRDALRVSRNEKKTAGVCAVVESPDAIEALVASEEAEPLELGEKADASHRPHGTTSAPRASSRQALGNAKGRKRPAEYCETRRTKDKKARTATVEPNRTTTASHSARLATTTSSPPTERSRTEDSRSNEIASIKVSRSSLPVLDEARYWADVDRFSFLA